MNQAEIQSLLRKQLAESQIKNPAYSIRSFAKKLGLSNTTLSLVLSGKRKLAEKSVRKILDRLAVAPHTQNKILSAPKQKISYQQSQLNSDQYFILSEWYYLAILNLIRTKDFNPDATQIAERLGVSVSLIRQAIARLERVGLIQFANGKMVRTKVSLSTSDGTPNLAVRKSHYQNLDRARASLDEHPFESCDFTSLTFAFESNRIKEAKEKIREFHHEFSEQFSFSAKPDEVYRLSVQLFGLSKPQGKNK